MTMDQLAAIVGPWLTNIQEAAGPLIAVLLQLLGIVLLDFLSGAYAALRTGTFNLKYVDAFVKDHIWTKVVPIVGAFVFAAMMGGTDSPAGVALGASAAGMLVAYDAATIKSVLENFASTTETGGNVPDGVAPPLNTTPLQPSVSEVLESHGIELSDEDIDRIAARLSASMGSSSDTN